MKKHILICGEKGVGKSTLIRRLVEEARLTVGGFCTKMDENAEGAMRPIYIYPASLPTDQRKRGVENLVGRCGNFGRQKEIFPEVFNALGIAYLQGTPSCQVIVMDELGFMESDAQAFRRAVLQTLDGEMPVLAAVKNRMDVEFLRQVCAHPRAEVVPINPENREELFCTLLPVVSGWKK
ncbi:MAG: hypothetical protein EGQ75_01395 [Clostridiales bacterium]|nr:hypothetical protein [Clostridiales bacterium]